MEKVIVITGPTGVGKTKLSISLAKKLDGEIINADSTQIFKGMDIATAKIKEAEKENIPHHLFDIRNMEEDYTVFDYQTDCRNKINEIKEKNKTPILVGGSGLYIKAALYDYKFDKEIKTYDYSKYSNEELYERLKKIDINTGIHPNNRKRIERALNFYDQNNKIPSSKEKTNKLLYDTIFIGLTTNREILYEKINNRVDKMIEEGLIEESKKIYKSNIRTKAVLTPIGYKEMFDYFENNKSLEEVINLIKQKSRNYAKRQYTWFNNQMSIKWFTTDYDNFDNTINEVLEYIKNIKNS